MNLKSALVAAGLALASSGASAAIQSVSVSGATVDFSYQYDDALPNLFNLGIYEVSGDSLSFSPTNFVAFQKGAAGWSDAFATTPLITVTAKSGYSLTGLSLFEQGDYYQVQSAEFMTLVTVSGQFIVNDHPNPFTSSDLDVALTTRGVFRRTEQVQTTGWSISDYADLNLAQSATVKVENLLSAGIDVGATALDKAFIEKKLMKISAQSTEVIAPVPVPGTVWMFGSALAGFLVSRRSKQQA